MSDSLAFIKFVDKWAELATPIVMYINLLCI